MLLEKSLTLLFRKVVEETGVPEDWKQANVTLYSSLVIRVKLVIIDQLV